MEEGTEFWERPGSPELFLYPVSVSSQGLITGGPLVCTSVPHQDLTLLFWVVMSILLLGSSENRLWVPRRPLTRV